MLNKKSTKFIITNSIIALLAYMLLFFRPKKKSVLEVGALQGDGVANYEALHFQDSEYFGKQPIPQEYSENYSRLLMVLDTVRIGFGSAVIISKGYQSNEKLYKECRAVQIYPQDHNHKRLFEVVKSLADVGKISIEFYSKMQNNAIYLSI